jgi:hypothetical protein
MTLHKRLVAAVLMMLVIPAAANAGVFGSKKKPQAPTAGQKLTAEQVALVDKMSAHEKDVLKAIQQRAPIVETYIQNMRPDQILQQIPESDTYFLNRTDFKKGLVGNEYHEAAPVGPHRGAFSGSFHALAGLGKALHLGTGFQGNGFVDMILPDYAGNLNRQTYDFRFVRREFLGEVRTVVFDVNPKAGTGTGRFFGRIWVEDQDGFLVRFNGSFTQGRSNIMADMRDYFHFDSWRTNVQPNMWYPSMVYVEESAHTNQHHTQAFKAQSRIWGYSLKVPANTGDSETVTIDAVKDNSQNAQDVSPLEAKRAFSELAENNILDRFYQAGLLAAPSDFDKILETVANNLIVTNNLPIDTIHCRVLLTTPLESLAIGNTIVLSKGLVDTLPYEEDLAAVISFQLAHIVLGHRLDTKYAFSDRMLFPDNSSFERIPMHHTDTDNYAAAKKGMELLANSPYKDKLANVGMYLAELQIRSKALTALNQPRVGDGFFIDNQTDKLWYQALLQKSPKIDMNNLTQIAALPLGSHLKVDAWDDRVIQLNVRPVALLNASDKLPFELTPVFLRLTRHTETPVPAQGASTATPQGASQSAATLGATGSGQDAAAGNGGVDATGGSQSGQAQNGTSDSNTAQKPH